MMSVGDIPRLMYGKTAYDETDFLTSMNIYGVTCRLGQYRVVS
jgi:hypothetical protein